MLALVSILGAGLAQQVINVSDVAYDATTWNANLDPPTKNSVRDKIETVTRCCGADRCDVLRHDCERHTQQ